MTLSAAIVGLGQAGSRFDEEPRPAVWSHAGAILSMPETYRLTGGADPSDENRRRFAQRCPQALTVADPVAMAAELRPDVLCLATPPQGRARLVESLLAAHRPRVLVLEKPMETEADARARLVAACEAASVPVLVHYNRRYLQVFRQVRAAVADGAIGSLTSVTVLAPNRLWSIGSHAVNLLLYLAGEEPESHAAQALPALEEGGEPAVDLLVRFPSGAAGRVLTAGFKDMLVFEADLIGALGRIRILDNGGRAILQRFEDSAQFVGYRRPGAEEPLHVTEAAESTFRAILAEAAEMAHGRAGPSSTARSALAGENLLDRLNGAYLSESAFR